MLKSMLAALAVLLLASPALARPAGHPMLPRPPVHGRPIVIGQSYTVRSHVLNQTRTINVWLPATYGQKGKTFPVLYLLDGGVQYEDFQHIAGLAHLGGIVGQFREMIVIGIAGIDRKHDFTSPSSDPAEVRDFPTTGGSAAFRRFLGSELEPWVQRHFKGDGERVLMGESLAGLFVTETFLRDPTLFDDYIAISPSLWWDKQTLSKDAAGLLATHPAGKRKLYLSIASEGSTMQAGVDRIVTALKTKAPEGLAWRYEPMPGETHATIYHPAALAAFRALMAQPPEAKK